MYLTLTTPERYGLMKAVFLGLLSLADQEDARASTVSIEIFWKMWGEAGPVEREMFTGWAADTLPEEASEILNLIITGKEQHHENT